MQITASSAQALSLSSAKHRDVKAFLSFAVNHFVLMPADNFNTNVEASKIAIDEHLVVEAAMIKAAIGAARNIPNEGAVSVYFTDDYVTPKGVTFDLETATHPAMMQITASSAQALSLSSAKHPYVKAFLSIAANHFVLMPADNFNTNVEASKIAVDEHLVVESAMMIKAAIDAVPNPKGVVSATFADSVKPLEMASPPSMGWIPVFKPLLSKLKNGRSFFKTLVMMYFSIFFSGVTANSVDGSTEKSVTRIRQVRYLELSCAQ
jgi:hypothetical protein